MILSEYGRAKRELKKGTPVFLTVIEKTCDMEVEGILEAVEHNKFYLTNGWSYHYKAVRSMTALPEKRIVVDGERENEKKNL